MLSRLVPLLLPVVTSLETQILIALVLGGMPISGGAKVRFENIIVGSLLYIVLNSGLTMMGFSTQMMQLIQGVGIPDIRSCIRRPSVPAGNQITTDIRLGMTHKRTSGGLMMRPEQREVRIRKI